MNVYPSMEELAPRSIRAMVPELLMQEIQERYETLGTKYLTDSTYEDGRRINGMVYTDRIVNCREEIIDAVFCIIGQIFKDAELGDREPSDNLFILLTGLINIYSMCVAMEDAEDYFNLEVPEVNG